MPEASLSTPPVVPYIGTWIETAIKSWKRDNKKVVPYIGTWIETILSAKETLSIPVVPYIGTWIETESNGRKLTEHQSYLI